MKTSSKLLSCYLLFILASFALNNSCNALDLAKAQSRVGTLQQISQNMIARFQSDRSQKEWESMIYLKDSLDKVADNILALNDVQTMYSIIISQNEIIPQQKKNQFSTSIYIAKQIVDLRWIYINTAIQSATGIAEKVSGMSNNGGVIGFCAQIINEMKEIQSEMPSKSNKP